MIYYFGGTFYTPTDVNNDRVVFDFGYTFNTSSGSWANETFHGDIPSERIYHTANLCMHLKFY
jgi:hypothetical protein